MTDPVGAVLDADLVDRIGRAHRTATGNATVPDVYGSDLRLLTGIGGIATLQYGPGDARLAHGPHESVPVDEVLVTARTLAALALDGAASRPDPGVRSRARDVVGASNYLMAATATGQERSRCAATLVMAVSRSNMTTTLAHWAPKRLPGDEPLGSC